MKEFFEKVDFEKNQQTTKKHEIFPWGQRVKGDFWAYTISTKTLCTGPGRVAQSVTCLATDECLTLDPGVASSIPSRYHTFVEIDHEIISTVILLPSADIQEGLLSVTSESMCTNYWLTACSSLPRKKCG